MKSDNAQIARQLRECADLVEAGDSVEGHISWGYALDKSGAWYETLNGTFRTNCRFGQGGLAIIPPDPDPRWHESGEGEPS